MSIFTKAYERTKALEGVYSDDPEDRGGETVNGIARKYWGDWQGWKIIDELKSKIESFKALEQAILHHPVIAAYAMQFYRVEFWDFLKLDNAPDQDIANELFDTAVNQGRTAAAKYMQEALNLLNENQKLFSDLKTDGLIGAKTLAAYNIYSSTSSRASRTKQGVLSTFLKCLNGLQFEHYRTFVKNNPEQERFFYGWLNNRIS